MRYCHFFIDVNKPEAITLIQQLEVDLRSIGIVLKPNGEFEYDETDKVLMDKIKAVFAKYPEALNLS